jgi:cardiolipin synthase
MTVDGCWSAIGSTNFDDRSFEINDEVAVAIFDEGMARAFEEIFERDLEHSTEAKLEQWLHRPLLHKLRDGAAFLFNEQL